MVERVVLNPTPIHPSCQKTKEMFKIHLVISGIKPFKKIGLFDMFLVVFEMALTRKI